MLVHAKYNCVVRTCIGITLPLKRRVVLCHFERSRKAKSRNLAKRSKFSPQEKLRAICLPRLACFYVVKTVQRHCNAN